MLVKFFNNKKGGSSASVSYLLNEREQNGTARTLKGDAELTKKLINSIEKKQKVTVGCLSFEEANPLTEEQKHEIIEDFENTLLPGMSQEQYNILWVEHTDKGRLELNFVIPKIELTTQKALVPFYIKQDFARVEMFEDITNIKYNLSSKKDPAKAQTLLGDKKIVKHIQDYQELGKTLHELVRTEQICNRQQLIETVKSVGIEVTRAGKDYLSLKLPDSKKARKFKGGIYDEQFRSIESIESISSRAEERARQYNTRDAQAELRETREKLDGYNEQKAHYNREKYKQNNARYTRAEQEQIHTQTDDSNINIDSPDIPILRSDTSGLHSENERENSLDSAKRDEIYNQRRDEIHRKQRQRNIHQTGEVNDSTRTAIEKRARERETALGNVRKSVQGELEINQEPVRAELKRVNERANQYLEHDSGSLYAEAQTAMREQRTRRSLRERLGEALESIGAQFIEIADYIQREFRGIKVQQKLSFDEKMEYIDKVLQETKSKPKDEEEPDYSYGFKM